MSITQDYENIRKELGEETYHDIERFLDYHPEYLLNNIYYNESVFKKFEAWSAETPKELKEAEPIYAVIHNIHPGENCFFGTKNEILSVLGIDDNEFERYSDEWRDKWNYIRQIVEQSEGRKYESPFQMDYDTKHGCYYIEVIQSPQELKSFIQNAASSDYAINYDKCGEKGLQIAKVVHAKLDAECRKSLMQLENENPNKTIPLEQRIADAETRMKKEKESPDKSLPDKERG